MAAQAQAAAPAGMPLRANSKSLGLPAAGANLQNFQKAVLEYARVPEALARRGTTCLPSSLAQCCRVCGRMRDLDLDPLTDPWIQRIIAIGVPNSLPIARVYVPLSGSNKTMPSKPTKSCSSPLIQISRCPQGIEFLSSYLICLAAQQTHDGAFRKLTQAHSSRLRAISCISHLRAISRAVEPALFFKLISTLSCFNNKENMSNLP